MNKIILSKLLRPVPFETSDDYLCYTVEFQQACQQALNDLHVLFFEKESACLEKIEMCFINNFLIFFSQNDVAKILNISTRTIRNKLRDNRGFN